jgi:MSHA pilin protein MshC
MRIQRGVTLVELVVVIVVVGILSAFVMTSGILAGTYSVPSQADTLARDLRHVQALAQSWGRSLRVTITTAGANGSYAVSCVTAGAAPCNVSPVIDPATGSSYTRSLSQDAVLAGTTSLDFDSFGKPSAAASYTVSANGAVKTISLTAVTGLVTVSP